MGQIVWFSEYKKFKILLKLCVPKEIAQVGKSKEKIYYSLKEKERGGVGKNL